MCIITVSSVCGSAYKNVTNGTRNDETRYQPLEWPETAFIQPVLVLLPCKNILYHTSLKFCNTNGAKQINTVCGSWLTTTTLPIIPSN